MHIITTLHLVRKNPFSDSLFQRILVRHKALTLDWILSHEVLEEAEPDAFIEKPRKTD